MNLDVTLLALLTTACLKLVIGDLNAQIDGHKHSIEHVLGLHSSAIQMNDNGEHLTLFCGMNSLCIGNTYFEHNRILKAGWHSPDSSTSIKINYICIFRQ